MAHVSDDTFRLRSLTYTTTSILAAIVLYIIAIGIARTEMPLSGDLRDLLRDIAIAVMVGVYLMWTLDRLNALKIEREVQEYIHTVGESFIKAVYGKQLPDELFQVVRTTIFDNNFVRNRYDIEVRLFNLQRYAEAAPDRVRFYLGKFIDAVGTERASAYLLVEFGVYYETTNVSQATTPCKVVLETPQPHGSFKGLAALSSVLIDGRQYLDRLYVENANPRSDPSHLSYETSVDVSPGKTIAVELNSYSVRAVDDKEPWQLLTPCRELTATVIDYETNSDVLIWLDAPAFEDTERVARKDFHTNTARLRVAQYLLPYQGVTMHWRPALQSGKAA